MDKSDYIKVTTGDGNTAIIPSANKDFYMSIGAQIEQPTDDEVAGILPPIVTGNTKTEDEINRLKESVRAINQEMEKLRRQIAKLTEAKKQPKKTTK